MIWKTILWKTILWMRNIYNFHLELVLHQLV